MSARRSPPGREHLDALIRAVHEVERELPRVDRWGRHLASVLLSGGRLLAAGNGGSAAEAQHLTAELVGRYRDERVPLSAISLHAETSSLTAIVNDYGAAAAFSRQVAAHGRPGDVLLVLSTSGKSENVLAAVEEGNAQGLTCWALTGRRPNPLASRCDDSIAVEADGCATVQEIHLALVHLLCEAVDRALLVDATGARAASPGPTRHLGGAP